jgi:hypothetical protein
MPIATGTFEITTMGEDTWHERDGEPRLARAHGTQAFSGDIEGDGRVEWLNCYSTGGPARLIGLQRVEGTVAGRRGSFVMEALADHDGKRSVCRWTVLDGSGSGALAGITGSGGFEAEGRTVSYTLTYDLG